MENSRLHLLWEHPGVVQRFQSGVSLHSHTLNSRESLSFIEKVCRPVPFLASILNAGRRRYYEVNGVDLDLSKAWWTPPLTPRDAYLVEARQIERDLGLRSMVSLSDHDSIESPLQLHVLDECRDIPVSVEWTVPVREGFFHIGVHNLPSSGASDIMKTLAAYTAHPSEADLPNLLEWLDRMPHVLLVLNHPFWDEAGLGHDRHVGLLDGLLAQCGRFLHALELNGLRPWKENRLTIRRARACHLPIISGGDRHGHEPNANLNLTNASDFASFVQEVRDGQSCVLFMPQYRESIRLRYLHNIHDVLRENPDHGLGWRVWSDRVFHEGADGVVRSLTAIFGDRPPAAIRCFVGMMSLIKYRGMRTAVRFALQEPEEFAG